MPEREPKKPTATTTEAAGSAPELPTTVAKQYGLHHHAAKKADTPTNEPLAATEAEGVTPEAPAAETEADTPELAVLSDPKTDAVVDSIIANESDELLAAEDALKQDAGKQSQPKPGFWRRIGRFFKAWATNPWARWITLIVLFASIVSIIAIPPARYFALNTAGVRSSASITVVDEKTNLPLKNVTVKIGGQQAQTAVDGKATLSQLKLGPQTLTIERLAFRSIKKQITVGWGSNPQDKLALTATGLQYTFEVLDYVGDVPLAGAEVSFDDLNALSDKKGVVTLTVSDRDPQPIEVALSKKGYQTQKITLQPSAPQIGKVRLVPSGKNFFVSNQSGSYDLYSADVDGKNRKAVLKATGNETPAIALAAAPAGDWAAMVATRDAVRSKDGYLLQSITLVNRDGTTVTTLERAEQIQLIGWVGTRVIYLVTVGGPSAANTQRNRLISYDYAANNRIQLATANQFNAVHIIKGTVYYAISATDPAVEPVLARIKADGTGRQTIWEKEVWTVWRTGYTSLALQTAEGWFTYNGSGLPSSVASPSQGRQYASNGDDSKAARVDTRDGKSVILVTDTDSGKERHVVTADGITYPLRWLNDNAIIYRVVTNNETADYIVNTSGTPAPRKITDVTNTYGFSRY